MFYALAGYGERFWKPFLSPDLLEDLRLDSIAQMFGVQPWEAGDIAQYWINRRQMFEKARQEAQDHNAKKNAKGK